MSAVDPAYRTRGQSYTHRVQPEAPPLTAAARRRRVRTLVAGLRQVDRAEALGDLGAPRATGSRLTLWQSAESQGVREDVERELGLSDLPSLDDDEEGE